MRENENSLVVTELVAQCHHIDSAHAEHCNWMLELTSDNTQHAPTGFKLRLRRLEAFILSGVANGWQRRNYPHV